ncbi:MAG: riboflavin biosynthesis protein RibF [Bacilli bacterium]|nr:riboflavin biosynthesis protein RibF [Bacilli bacterium]
MEVIYIDDLNKIENRQSLVMCLGYFDGLHLGHQELIKKCREVSKDKNLVSSLLTFDPSPSKVLNLKKFKGNLTSLEDRLNLINQFGIEKVFVLKFDLHVASITKEDFIKQILQKLNVKDVVVGFDFSFGKFGEGNNEYLKQFFNVHIVDELKYNGEKIASSYIANLLIDGDVSLANKLLGHNYIISGEVIHGYKNGKKIGYPTANINYGDYVLLKRGVYACYTYVNGCKYKSMVNVGSHPTIKELDKPIIESYIFDFYEDIYGQIIKIEFIKYIREEEKFSSLEKLKSRLNLDTKLIANILE